MRPLLLPVVSPCSDSLSPARLRSVPPLSRRARSRNRPDPRGPPHPPRALPPAFPSRCGRPPGWPAPGEVVRSGVPLPRSLGVHDPRSLAVLGPDGKPVPAEFHTWPAGTRGRTTPRPHPVGAGGLPRHGRRARQRHLYPGGGRFRRAESAAARAAAPQPPGDSRWWWRPEPPPSGWAASPGSCSTRSSCRTARRSSPGGTGMTLRAAGDGGGHSTVRDVRIESQGALLAVVVIDGAYDLPPIGGGQLGSRRRYVFTAGSSTVVVRHAVAWEGDLACTGCLKTKDGKPDGVLVEKVRDTLTLDRGTGHRDGGRRLQGARAGGCGRGCRQGWERSRRGAPDPARPPRGAAPLRDDGRRPAPRRQAGGRRRARRLRSRRDRSPVAIDHMHRYEPQALRLLADGRLAVDLADGKAWLANHQGMFATLAVAALPGAAKRADLDRLVWAPLNRPLRAWPDAAWFTASEAVDEVPAGRLPKDLAAYDELIPKVLKTTAAGVDAEGLAGLMTFGVYPRYWGTEGGAGRDRLQGGGHDAGRGLGRHLLVRLLDRLPQHGRDLGALGDALGGGRVARRARRPRRPAHAPHPDYAVRPRRQVVLLRPGTHRLQRLPGGLQQLPRLF